MKRAFTLIELLIVIAIIGILAGVLLSSFGGATESAKMAKCQSNLRSLAAAVNAYTLEAGHFPYAGSAQYYYPQDDEILINVHRGWISWLDAGQFDGRVTEEKSISQCSFAGSFNDVEYALTHGAIWRATGKNRSTYQCPVHVKACVKKSSKAPGWSYAMNPYFGYERQKGKAMSSENEFVGANDLSRTDRRLLFAEIQGLTVANLAKYGATSLPKPVVSGGNGNSAADCILQYWSTRSGKTVGEEGSAAESIGFNHIRGNRIVGLVAFADGHTEMITLPKGGSLEQLTGWLCDGYDITLSNGNYEKIDDSDVN